MLRIDAKMFPIQSSLWDDVNGERFKGRRTITLLELGMNLSGLRSTFD